MHPGSRHFSLIKYGLNGRNVAYIHLYKSACVYWETAGSLDGDVWIDVYSVLPTWFRPPQLWSLLFVTLSAGRYHTTLPSRHQLCYLRLRPSTPSNVSAALCDASSGAASLAPFVRSLTRSRLLPLASAPDGPRRCCWCRRRRRLATAYPFN